MNRETSFAEDSAINPESLKLPGREVFPLFSTLQNSRRVVQYSKFISTMPLEWATTACKLHGKAIHVALAIWLLSSLSKSQSIRLAQKQLETFGVSRYSAYRALRQLERAGLITVERKNGRAPRVTIADRLFSPNCQSGNGRDVKACQFTSGGVLK